MKKIVLLTFMLLSGFSLSAQTEEITFYKYDSFVYIPLLGSIDKPGVNEGLYIAAYDNESFLIHFPIVKGIMDASIVCVYQKQDSGGRYYYTGFDVLDTSNQFIISTPSKLNSFLHNSGIEDSDHLDLSKAIFICRVDDLNTMVLFPIKNK